MAQSAGNDGATRRKVGILTSGGDAPGMNAAIRSATKILITEGVEVVGIQHGYRGLLKGEFRPLGAADVNGVIRDGGTFLGSARCLEFLERAGRDEARRQARRAGIDSILAIGGNGTLAGAAALCDPEELGDQDLKVVGLPASIDNDVGFTGMAIGTDTAMNTIVEACDKISDTASAHDRIFLVEVMGRECGYLAMTSSIASAADAVFFPEANRSESELVQAVVTTVERARKRPQYSKRVLIIVAEGMDLSTNTLKERVEFALNDSAAEEDVLVETRVTVLGHVVRGGRPTAFDRLLGSRLAHVGVRALLAGETRKMVGWILPGQLPAEVSHPSEFDPYCNLIDLGAVLAETARMNDGTSPLVKWRRMIFEQIEEALSL